MSRESHRLGQRRLREIQSVCGGCSLAEENRSAPEQREPEAGIHAGRLGRRLEALERRHRRLELRTPLELLTTRELKQVLDLIWRARVLPNGEVRSPWVFQEATPEEWDALERWKSVWGEPLDHLEAAEELLDRMGEAYGWRSREAAEVALLLERLEMPEESSWFVGKMAEGMLNFYAELTEHPREPDHPKVRAAIRRLNRLQEMDRLPFREGADEGLVSDEEDRSVNSEESLREAQQPGTGWPKEIMQGEQRCRATRLAGLADGKQNPSQR
jgi:hypothetical protein